MPSNWMSVIGAWHSGLKTGALGGEEAERGAQHGSTVSGEEHLVLPRLGSNRYPVTTGLNIRVHKM